MNNAKIQEALQELIIKLQDAEKMYTEIYNATSNIIIKNWMKKYTDERHEFHRELELQSYKLGGHPVVKTSIMGELHRFMIDVKLNNIDGSIPTIINEIEKGSNVLLDDYKSILNLDMSKELRVVLNSQMRKINQEKEALVTLREELLSPV